MPSEPMWCVVMFDLPTKSAAQRREYSKFRHMLLDLGFMMTQYSVYSKYSPSGVLSNRVVSEIKTAVPAGGQVRILHVSDREWAATIRFSNALPETAQEQPEQLVFF